MQKTGADWRFLLFLTISVLLVHGFHPWAEDGGLYATSIEHILGPTLFPGDQAFVTEPTRFSLFAVVLAGCCRTLHLSLGIVLLLAYLGSTLLMFWATRLLTMRLFASSFAQRLALALVAAVWTLPIAGTSLLLMDPYVTARSFAVPLTMLALGQMLPTGRLNDRKPNVAIRTISILLLAALFHVLMAGYGALLCLCLWITRRRRSLCWSLLLGSAVIGLAWFTQCSSPPENLAITAARLSRSYWFLSQWHWYEDIGLLVPLLFFAIAIQRRPNAFTPGALACCRAAILSGAMCTVVALLFAREDLHRHFVASLQPLRIFLLLYVLFFLLLGGAIAEWLVQWRSDKHRLSAFHFALLLVLPVAITMFAVQRAVFPSSPHLELVEMPTRNPWEQAFRWVHIHTPQDAVFALDAGYISLPREDAQDFRAIAERSVLADYSKDGGEASIAPGLALRWLRDVNATRGLEDSFDQTHRPQLRALGVRWIIVPAVTPLQDPCPYRNDAVKVCMLQILSDQSE